MPTTVSAAGWQKLADGLDYATVPVHVEGQQVELSALKIDLQRFAIRPIYEPNGETVKNLAEKAGAVAAINANFFDEKGGALGLVKIAGETKHAQKNISWWSVFCVNDNEAHILHSTKQTQDCHHAVQAGPRLVVNQTLTELKQEISQKSAIGLKSETQVVLVVSRAAIPITVLAQTLQKSEAEGGLGCLEALNLDGGSSTQLYVNVNGFTVNIPNLTEVPVGLGVFRK